MSSHRTLHTSISLQAEFVFRPGVPENAIAALENPPPVLRGRVLDEGNCTAARQTALRMPLSSSSPLYSLCFYPRCCGMIM